MKGLIGKKIGMTQVFDEDGNLVPVTVIDASTCTVVGKRTPERDQYSAVTLGFGKAKEKRLTAAQKGAFKKAGVEARRCPQGVPRSPRTRPPRSTWARR